MEFIWEFESCNFSQFAQIIHENNANKWHIKYCNSNIINYKMQPDKEVFDTDPEHCLNAKDIQGLV